MTFPSSTFIFSVVFMAFLGSMMVTGVPTAVGDRQSRQMLLTPQYHFPSHAPLLAFYNPYAGEVIVNPAEMMDSEKNPIINYIYKPSAGGFAIEAADGIRGSARTRILILPSENQCLTADLTTNGGGGCRAVTSNKSGYIDIRLIVAGQLANVAITAPSSNTRIRVICREIVGASVFTQTGRINAPSDTPRIEFGFLNFMVVSTEDNARVRCTWHR